MKNKCQQTKTKKQKKTQITNKRIYMKTRSDLITHWSMVWNWSSEAWFMLELSVLKHSTWRAYYALQPCDSRIKRTCLYLFQLFPKCRVSINCGTSKMDGYFMENPFINGWFGGTPMLGTPKILPVSKYLETNVFGGPQDIPFSSRS